jgi:uncharacterized secreted protein with C-terminal beta-propeller domain
MSLRKFERNLKKEYNETFKETKPKFRFTFQLKHALAILVLLLGVILLSDYIAVNAYNNKLAKEKDNLYDINETSFIKLESKNDYKNIVNFKRNKSTIITKLFSGLIPKAYDIEAEFADSDVMIGMPKEENPEPAPESSIENATNTNVQVDGIDEADYSKCDGNYIYSLNEGNFSSYYIFTDVVNFSQYLILGTTNGFVQIREFPEMKLLLYEKVFDGYSVDKVIPFDTANNSFIVHTNSNKAIPRAKIIYNPTSSNNAIFKCHLDIIC